MKGTAILLAAGLAAFGICQGRRTELDEARLALTNALVQEVKSGRQASFSVRWDYLPESKGLKEQYLNVFTFDHKGKLGQAHEYILPNETLRNRENLKKWFDREIKRDDALRIALAGGNREATVRDLDLVLKEGRNHWDQSYFEGLGFAQSQRGVSRVPWNQYIAAKRDFFAMRYLLGESSGAVLTFNPAPRGENPMMLSNGLTWRIRVIPVQARSGNPLYRFTVAIQSKTVKKLFRGSGDDPAAPSFELKVTVGLLKEDQDPLSNRRIFRMAKVSLADNGSPIEVNTEGVRNGNTLEGPTSTLTPSTGSALLDVFAGATPQGLLAPLVSNNSEAQLFTGGLLGQGSPTTVYGLNYTFTEQTDGNLGLLYAFVPKADSGLYLGPSLSLGPFILSVGAQFFNTLDDTLSTRLAGTISIDLSRVFGKSGKPIPIDPRLQNAGSDIWADSEKLYESKILFMGRVQGQGTGVTLKQVADAEGNPAQGPVFSIGQGELGEPLLAPGQYSITPAEGFEMAVLPMKSESPIDPVPANLRYVSSHTLLADPGETYAFVFILRPKAP